MSKSSVKTKRRTICPSIESYAGDTKSIMACNWIRDSVEAMIGGVILTWRVVRGGLFFFIFFRGPGRDGLPPPLTFLSHPLFWPSTREF